MRKLLLAAMALVFAHFCYAQDEPKTNKQNEEIIIRDKGDKDMNLTVQINGDSIWVNGKPLSEFIDSQISIKKRKMYFHNDSHGMNFDFGDMQKQLDDGQKEWNDQWNKSKPFLGVTTAKDDNGVLVTEVIDGSAAEKAGLKEGDVITKIDDEKIDDPESLSKMISGHKPKDEIKIYYKRDGKNKSAKAILGENNEMKTMMYSFHNPMFHSYNFPEQQEAPEAPEAPEMQEAPELPEIPEMPEFNMPHQKKLGLKIQDTEDNTVKVISVEDSSAAAKAGILKDDIITEINGEKITNTDEARDQLHPDEGKNSYDIKVLRNGKEMDLNVKIPKKLKTANL